jgi:hypothetical protein
MATRAGSAITEINSSFVSLISRPNDIVRIIVEAVRATD